MTYTKEFENILIAIEKWINKHKGKVQFVGSFMAFKGEDFDIVDDRMLAYGDKSMMRIILKELDTEVEKEQEDFVNW